MKVRALAAAAALSIVAPLGALATATTASATTVSVATATIRSYIVRNGDGSATLSASYTCPEGFHLWISAKQSADGRYDPALMGEGSSEVSAAWLQSHPVNFTCDGRSHTQSFVIDTSEQGFGTLQRGVAWAQFCLIGENTFIFKGQWVAVI